MNDDLGDDHGPPLPPEDRLWRHPSEVARAQASTPTPPATRGRRAVLSVGVVSCLAGAAATVVALAAMGTFTTVADDSEVAATSTRPPSTTIASARTLATSVGPAVVEISATVDGVVARGSGVVARSDGLVLTSAQLVAGATGIAVTWPSGRRQVAELEGLDPLTGLAAVSVAGSGFPTAALDISPPRPGEQAITVSARSADSGPTVVDGRVNATSSHVTAHGEVLVGLIETDTPVPADADGGALVDDQGNLRGVCLSLGAGTAGWAVPAEVAMRVADDLRRLGRVDRGWLGVSGSPAAVDGAVPAGFAVDAVAPGSPAEVSGVVVGDVILAVDDHRVRSLDDVKAALTLTRPGHEVGVELSRDDRTVDVRVALQAAP